MATKFFTILVYLTTALSVSGCEKYWLDKRMAELCNSDGGIKVYETIKLQPSMFDQNGDPFPGWRKRKLANRLSDEYSYSRTEIVLKDGDPFKGQGLLFKSHIKIIRKIDSKILGEAITYFRSGGDGMLLGHPSSSSCPTGDGRQLITSVFIK